MVKFTVRSETRLGPGPYSVYVDGVYLTTVDTKAEVEQAKQEYRGDGAEARDATSSVVTTSPA